MIIGPNGTAFACSDRSNGEVGSKGVIAAYRVSDGSVLWRRELDLPCTSWPAVTADGREVIVPIAAFMDNPLITALPAYLPIGAKLAIHQLSLLLGGSRMWWQPGAPRTIPSEVLSLDAATGRVLWRYEAEPYDRRAPMGDEEGFLERMRLTPARSICLPAMWGSPTIAGDGTVYVGRSDGRLYAVRGDAASGRAEATTFFTGAGALHPGAALAPGLMAFATCDSLFVFHSG